MDIAGSLYLLELVVL